MSDFLSMLTAAAEWKERGACRGMDPDLFFPEQGETAAVARRTCAHCPVTAECLEAGMDEHTGFWGGTSPKERREIRRRRMRADRWPERFASLHPIAGLAEFVAEIDAGA